MTPTAEDFERWKDDPVTLWVFRALGTAAEEQREAWLAASWVSGVTNPERERVLFDQLRELRTRADAYSSMIEADYLAFCQWNGDEPNG